jgi:hypothetical protein
MLLSALCLLAAPTLPARASAAVDVAAVDKWQCLVWLLTDPDAHAAECGGPFHMDEGTDSLSPGSFAPCQYLTGEATLPELEFLERVDVAQSIDCCYAIPSSFDTFDLTFGEELVVAQEVCPDNNPD